MAFATFAFSDRGVRGRAHVSDVRAGLLTAGGDDRVRVVEQRARLRREAGADEPDEIVSALLDGPTAGCTEVSVGVPRRGKATGHW